jgi:low temperature requirement protein LtrA
VDAEAEERRSVHLRPRDGTEQRTTAVELFFDLVYAFALTQLAQLVLDGHLSLRSLAQAAFLLLVVWWAWIYTTWWVNWFDPASVKVRLVVAFVAMGSLLVSTAIPDAFGVDAWLFAGSYVVMQVGRNCSALLLLPAGHRLRPVFERILAWSLLCAVLWLGGAAAHGTARAALWGIALVLDLAAPALGYRTPRLGRSQTVDWDVDGGHFAERFQSFVIIALGETIVATGATGSRHGMTTVTVLAVAISFVTIVALWWLYFSEMADGSRRALAESDDPGGLARDAYTYLHLPIIAGVIMVAIGDDLLVGDPSARLSLAGAVITVGGPALYLLGETSVRLRMIGSVSRKRLTTVVALALVGALAAFAGALAVAIALAVILVILCIAEYEPQPSSA